MKKTIAILFAILAIPSQAFADDGKTDGWAPRPDPIDSVLCKNGNCPCGKTSCAEGAVCIDKHCYCTNIPPWAASRNGPSDDWVVVDGFGEFLCEYMPNSGTGGGGYPLLYCDKDKGCKTDDGVHYIQGAFVNQDASMFDAFRSEWNYGYYFVKDPDTSYQTISPNGDCVLNAPVDKKYPRIKITSDTSYEYDEKGHVIRGSLYDDGQGERTFEVPDLKSCKGGKFYCHGPVSLPAEKPGDGYLCQTVDYETLVRTWICDDEKGCSCGGKPCAHARACVHGVCMNPKEVKPDRPTPKKATEQMGEGHDGITSEDGALIALCGRESAEKVKRDMRKWDAFVKAQKKKKVPKECWNIDPDAFEPEADCPMDIQNSVDRCQVRMACETWNIPRANRNQYVCEFDVGTHYMRYFVDSYHFPKAVGLRCVDAAGCVCKNSTIPKDAYCNYYEDGEIPWDRGY